MAQTPVGCIVPQLIAQDPEGTKVYIYSKYHGPANSRGFAGSGIQSVQSGALARQSGLVGRKKEHLPQRTSQENKCERTPQFKSHCRRVVCTDHRSAVLRPARGARLYTLYPEPETANPWPSPGTEGEALPLVHPVADVGLELRRRLLWQRARARRARARVRWLLART